MNPGVADHWQTLFSLDQCVWGTKYTYIFKQDQAYNSQRLGFPFFDFSHQTSKTYLFTFLFIRVVCQMTPQVRVTH